MDIIWINNNNEMINKFFDKLANFIDNNNKDFKLNTDNEIFLKNFSIFLYDNFIRNNYKSDIIKEYANVYQETERYINFNDYDFSDSTGEGKMYIINLIKKILHFRNLKIIK